MAQSRVAASGVTTRSAINVDAASYWTNDNPWLDQCKRGRPWSDVRGATVRADGWLQDLQPGGSAQFHTHLSQDTHYGFIPPGRYVAKNSQGVTMQFIGSAAGNPVADTRRATCTVVDSAHPPSQGDLGIRITNRTGRPVALFDTLRIFLERDETAVDAGAIWRPEKIAALGNAAVLRTMTLSSPNLLGEDRYELDQPGFLPLVTDRSYAASGVVPYGACANLAATADRDLWICFPYCVDSLRYELDAGTNRVYPLRNRGTPGRFVHGWSEGTALCFPTEGRFTAETGIPGDVFLYVRNPDEQGFQLSTTPGGPVDVQVKMTTGLNKGYSWVSMTRVFTQEQLYEHYRLVAAQVRQHYDSTGRIFVEAGNEPWNNAFRQTQFLRGFFSQLAGTWKGGTLQQRTGGANAWLSLLAWKAMLEQFPRSQLVFVLNGQVAWWDRLGGRGGMFDYVDPGLVMPGRRVADIVDEYALAPYTAPRNPATGKYYTAADYHAENATNQPDSWWSERFIAENTLVARDWVGRSVEKAKEKNPAMRITTYETGQHIWDEVGQMSPENLALTLRIHRFLSGPGGAAIFEDHYRRAHEAFGLTLYNQFVDAGGWYTKRFLNGGWGLRPHSDAPANSRVDWFNGLPGKPTSIGEPVAQVRALGIVAGGVPPSGLPAQQRQSGWTQQMAAAWDVGSTWEMRGRREFEAAADADPRFTHVLIAGPPDLLGSLQHRQLVDELLERCEAIARLWPGARPLLWHAWNTGDTIGPTAATAQRFVLQELKMQKAWDAVTACVNLRAGHRGAQWQLQGVPAAYCVARLVDHACNDRLAGISGATVADTLAGLFGGVACDGAASPDAAAYYVQLVRMSALHRRCALGAWHPDTLDAVQAASLQQVCWRSLVDYHNWYAWAPTMPQARAFLSGDADLTAFAHLGARTWSAGFFGSEDPASGNPFADAPAG